MSMSFFFTQASSLSKAISGCDHILNLAMSPSMCNFDAGLYFHGISLAGMPSLNLLKRSILRFVSPSTRNSGRTDLGKGTEGSSTEVTHFSLADSMSSSARYSSLGITSGMSL